MSKRLLWSFKADSILGASPAATQDGACWFGSRSGRLYHLDGAGQLRWTFEASGPIEVAPLIHPAGFVAFGCYDGKVRALNNAGKLLWHWDAGAPVMTSMCLDDHGNLAFGDDKGRLNLLSPEGELVAQHPITDLLFAPPIHSSGTTWIADQGLHDDAGASWPIAAEPIVGGSAVGADGTLHLGSWDARLYAVRAGQIQWQAKLEGQVYGGCSLGPAGEVLIGTRAGWVSCFARTGERLWAKKLRDGVYGTPAIASGGVVFVPTNANRLYALALDSGEVLWAEHVGRDIRSSPLLLDDGRVLVCSWDFSIYCFEGGAGGPTSSPWPQFQRDATRRGRAPLVAAE